jgi:phosphoribosylformylglycinamidine cyclo-ligase
MPGFYDEGKYDIAGFTVGIADRKKIIDGGKIREGDTLLGLASSGPHSNGFSLIRKALPCLDEDFGGMPVGRALLEPTRLYVAPVLSLMEQVELHGMANITGGGFYENIPRMFPAIPGGGYAFDAAIADPLKPDYSGGWKIPPIFARIACGVEETGLYGAEAQKKGEYILRDDPAVKKLMFNTFNMGIGFVIALAPEDAGKAAAFLESRGFPSWEIGCVETARGNGEHLYFR